MGLIKYLMRQFVTFLTVTESVKDAAKPCRPVTVTGKATTKHGRKHVVVKEQ